MGRGRMALKRKTLVKYSCNIVICLLQRVGNSFVWIKTAVLDICARNVENIILPTPSFFPRWFLILVIVTHY